MYKRRSGCGGEGKYAPWPLALRHASGRARHGGKRPRFWLAVPGGALVILFALAGMQFSSRAGCLNWWPLSDTNWLSASSSGPMGCTNLAYVTNLDGLPMGDGAALEVNTNVPAFLRYPPTEDTG